MTLRTFTFALIAVSLSLAGCNCGQDPSTTVPAPVPGTGGGGGSSTVVDAGIDAGTIRNTQDLIGVWTVSGSDVIGAYTGTVEVRPAPLEADAGSAIAFIRVIQYTTVTVEDGRQLWWAWEGSARDLSYGPELDVTLAVRDFIKERGTLTRSVNDQPVQVVGRVVGGAAITATYSASGISATETWTNKQPNGAAPIFASSRTTVGTNAEPTDTNKTLYRSLFNLPLPSNPTPFWALPGVSPFVSKPEFQKMVHQYITEATDLEFYRANPNALRVVNKVIDPISQLETLQRANAFRQTLADKGNTLAIDTWTRFVSASGVAMVPDAVQSDGGIVYSGDSALWTAMFIGAEADRYAATQDATALDHMKAALDAELKLMEITGDASKFARALRPNTALEADGGTTTDGWVIGTGAYATLQYLPGGNNDMMKGLQYAYFLGWRQFCSTGALRTANTALCTRMKKNIGGLTGLDIGTTSTATNYPLNSWLTAYTYRGGSLGDCIKNPTGCDSVQFLKYTGIAEATVQLSTSANALLDNIQNGPVLYVDGITDWSGLHLNFVELAVRAELSNEDQMNLTLLKDITHPTSGGTISTKDATSAEITDTEAALRREHHPLYHALAGALPAFGYSGPNVTTQADLDDLRWTLRSYRHGVGAAYDASINPNFSVSPFPSLPWKYDWDATDRVAALARRPLYELPPDVYHWKDGRDFRGSTPGSEYPSVDYLTLYWFARAHGVISAAE